MDRERGGIQIALEVKPSFLDEALVFRVVRDWKQKLSAVCGTSPPKIGIYERIRARQQPRGFRWSNLSQLNRDRNRRSHDHHCQNDGESAPYSHEMRVRDEMIAS